MSDREEPGRGEFEITPEEDRFLRAFFRRQALRYLGVLAAVAALAVTGTIAVVEAPPSEPASAAARPDPGTIAALENFRAEGRQLHDDFEALSRRLGKKKGASAAEVAALNDRIEAMLSRLGRLEQRPVAEAAPGDAATVSPPDSAGSWDVSAILERLYNVEMRQDAARTGVGRAVLERLDRLEQRSAQLEGSVLGPGTEADPSADPAP